MLETSKTGSFGFGSARNGPEHAERVRGWTRAHEVSALVEQHRGGSRDHAKRIWALVCLELWARAHVDRVYTDRHSSVDGRVEQCA